MVIVEYNSEWATLYAHLDSINIEEGDWVKQGDILGKMGATGRTTGVHLHFEIRRNRKAVDPLLLLP
jgi:murein DD-endopeptidase MepM/ murein hydrolase activator NlpD